MFSCVCRCIYANTIYKDIPDLAHMKHRTLSKQTSQSAKLLANIFLNKEKVETYRTSIGTKKPLIRICRPTLSRETNTTIKGVKKYLDTRGREWKRTRLRAFLLRSRRDRTSRYSSGRCWGLRPRASACRASPCASSSLPPVQRRHCRSPFIKP